jgi:hypothetical protein
MVPDGVVEVLPGVVGVTPVEGAAGDTPVDGDVGITPVVPVPPVVPEGEPGVTPPLAGAETEPPALPPAVPPTCATTCEAPKATSDAALIVPVKQANNFRDCI